MEHSQRYIEYGYDRKAKSWCIIVFDENGYEITSSYEGNKDSAKSVIDYFKNEYKIEKVVKIKAY